jgi:predicted enzyme related to lactoylglutathione lyase
MVTRDSAWAPGTPCWVDLMTTDVEAARTFYGDLLGWQFDIGPAETGYYSSALLDGRRVAGIFTMQNDHPPVWSTYLATADVEATAKAAEAAGGTIFQAPMDVMDLGRMAVIQDPTGAAVGLWQAGSHFGFQLANQTGAVTWNEELSRDYDAATRFYAEVFGYTYTDMSGEGFRYSTIEVDGNTVGGIGALPAQVPAEVPSHWRVYFAVDDADDTVARAVATGAQVIRPAQDMPYGRHADLQDPQGAYFSIIRPGPGPS